MGEGYRLVAVPASSSVQPDFEAFVVAPRRHPSGGLNGLGVDAGGTRSGPSCRTTEQKGDARCPPGRPISRSMPTASHRRCSSSSSFSPRSAWSRTQRSS